MLKNMTICIISIAMKEKMIILRSLMEIKNKFDLCKFQSVSLVRFQKQYLMSLTLKKTLGINFSLLTESFTLNMKDQTLFQNQLIRIIKEDFKHAKKVCLFGHHQALNSKNLTLLKTTLMMKITEFSHRLENMQDCFHSKTNVG